MVRSMLALMLFVAVPAFGQESVQTPPTKNPACAAALSVRDWVKRSLTPGTTGRLTFTEDGGFQESFTRIELPGDAQLDSWVSTLAHALARSDSVCTEAPTGDRWLGQADFAAMVLHEVALKAFALRGSKITVTPAQMQVRPSSEAVQDLQWIAFRFHEQLRDVREAAYKVAAQHSACPKPGDRR